ncbi:hypothetical protein HMPREF3291_18425 [Bacillus sp. HMSC76G11]|nr:hypothetical protein HMPREF3291_18425 [Bacillus sp. HMSC76G11]
MQKKWVRILNYQIYTPKLNTSRGVYQEERFDSAHFISLLNFIIGLPIQDRLLDSGDKFMTLEGFGVSDDADFYEGHFTTARYGEVNNLVHRRTFVKRQSDKTIDEGDENNIYFVIENSTGKLFLQGDSKRLVTRSSIDKYFRTFLGRFESQIEEFNRQLHPLLITPRNLYTINTVFSEEFFSEINNLVRIKRTTMKIKYNQDTNSEVVNAIRSGSEGVQGADEIEYSIVNKERGGGMKKVIQFLRNLEEREKYENIIVVGNEQSGRNKAIKLEDHPKDFSIQVSVNTNGIISFQELIDGIIEKVKRGPE